MAAAENFIYIAVGKKGYGKTTELLKLVRACRRALFADPEGKFDPQRAGDRIVFSARELLELCRGEGWEDPRKAFRVIYRDRDLEAMKLTAPSLALAIRNCTLVIDECCWFHNRGKAAENLVRILQVGREAKVNLLCTTRKPQELESFFFDCADQVDLFHMGPGRGYERIAELYPELAEGLLTAPRLVKVAYADDPHPELLGREGLDA